jgi:hypothetical protein
VVLREYLEFLFLSKSFPLVEKIISSGVVKNTDDSLLTIIFMVPILF